MKSTTLKTVLCLIFAIGLIGWGNPGFAAGSGNTATGTDALASITTGSFNTAYGF